ncbi:MAG: hypothetical protein AAFV27_04685, partial [Pseudomonadota bacterium]
RAGQAAALPALTQALAGLAAQDPDDLGLHKTDGAPWHPIALEWETALHPMASSGPLARQTARYAPDDLTAAYDLAPDGPDLVPKPRVMPLEGYATVTSGRAVLTPYAHAMLQDRQRVAEMAGLDPSLLPTAAAQDHSDTQSQALGGFHSALLQRREAMAIPPDDPLAPDGPNEDTRALSRDRIAAALRRSGAGLALSAASPNQPFVPLRAGRLSLRRLRLIDAFGQIRDLSTGLTARAGRLDTLPAAAHDTYLPPRLAQPARLNFRWLSASSGLVEATEEASSTPVCGWLSVSPMEAALAVHASDGRALGEIAPGAPAPWQPAPGEAGMPPEAFENAGLARVVQSLTRQDPVRLTAMMEAVSDALEHILPRLGGAEPALALLTGRPLAVVRARLSLELQGALAIDQSWTAFAEDLRRAGRDTGGIETLRCPVRLGERGRLDDGLAGFWLEDAQRRPAGPLRVPALSAQTGVDPAVIGPQDPDFAVTLTPNGPPVTVTMLLDPLGKVHATCGLVPVKSIDIPQGQVRAALAVIETWISTAPLLTPVSGIEVPLPALEGRSWSWTARTATGWDVRGPALLRPPRQDARFDGGKIELREGWLMLKKDPRA